MTDFWKLSGYRLLSRGDNGQLEVTHGFLRAYLARPEIRPIETSCAAETDLYGRLLNDPCMAVTEKDLAAFKDPDAADNYRFFLRFRKWLAAYPSLEAAYLGLVRGAGPAIPPLFVDHVVQVIVRGILCGSCDPLQMRAYGSNC